MLDGRFPLENGMIVERYTIIGTADWVKHTVWEPAQGYTSHHSFRTIDGKLYGELTSRRLPVELEALTPRSELRYNAVKAYHAGLRQLTDAILRTYFKEDFPEDESTTSTTTSSNA